MESASGTAPSCCPWMGSGGLTTLEVDHAAGGHRPGAQRRHLELQRGHRDRRAGSDRGRRVPATTAEGVFALGDVSTHFLLKHVANEEARTRSQPAAPDVHDRDRPPIVPQRRLLEPQIAAVGLTEQEAEGVDYRVGAGAYCGVACRMGDGGHRALRQGPRRRGHGAGRRCPSARAARLLADPAAGPGDELGQPVADVACGQYWIHLALAEVVENALLDASGR